MALSVEDVAVAGSDEVVWIEQEIEVLASLGEEEGVHVIAKLFGFNILNCRVTALLGTQSRERERERESR